ncbi:MAG TPA: RES family NAD+ phosphorylase [Longimicrobium sp.]|nr:RES family NAD+ phosphorylase [Longimicrobium sp.]
MPIVLPAKLPLVVVEPSRPLWRVHESSYGAIWFGTRADKRFDDPAGGFGVMYLGESPAVAVLETLVRGSDRCVVDQREWNRRSVSQVYLAAELRMVRFEGPGLRRFGIGAERAHAGGYAECQALSAALHARHPDVDGIQFRSRWDTSQLCWAVFDRARPRIKGAGAPKTLKGSRIGDQVLDECEIQLV